VGRLLHGEKPSREVDEPTTAQQKKRAKSVILLMMIMVEGMKHYAQKGTPQIQTDYPK
jgi:hypothetical protein